jgi:Ca-activated chloride channel family protein
MSRRIVTRLILAILAGTISGHAAAGTWSDLWSTHEQQGQQLLDSNHPGEAATLFSDPKRRAYAQLQAGQYAKAAELLAPLKDADSQYNRGNALAHTGKLRDALTAYDAALASSPGNQDVLRNRELVEKALQAQNQQQRNGGGGKGQQGHSNSGGQGSNGAGEKQAGQQGQQPDGSNPAQAGSQGQPGQQNQSGNQGQSGSQGQAAQSQPGQQPKDASQAQAAEQNRQNQQANGNNQPQPGQQNQSGGQGQATAQNQPGQQPNGANPAQQAQAANAPQPARPNQQDQQDPHDVTQQAQMSGTGTQRADGSMSDSPIVKGSAAVDSHQSQPRSEQALALDQWLRGIPEDSSELLRRKFLIEHLMRQQGYQP